MMKKLRLDLHTHCFEALADVPNAKSVKAIVDTVRRKGLDGIAITEHMSMSFGLRAKEIAEQELGDDILLMPGREIADKAHEVVEVLLPNGSVFRFLAHPYSLDFYRPSDDIHGIEIQNFLHNFQIDEKIVKKMAQDYSLILLNNSDAHALTEIGSLYTEISLEELQSQVINQKLRTMRANLEWLEKELVKRDQLISRLLERKRSEHDTASN